MKDCIYCQALYNRIRPPDVVFYGTEMVSDSWPMCMTHAISDIMQAPIPMLKIHFINFTLDRSYL